MKACHLSHNNTTFLKRELNTPKFHIYYPTHFPVTRKYKLVAAHYISPKMSTAEVSRILKICDFQRAT